MFIALMVLGIVLFLPFVILNLELVKIGINREVPITHRHIAGYALIIEAAVIGILAVILIL